MPIAIGTMVTQSYRVMQYLDCSLLIMHTVHSFTCPQRKSGWARPSLEEHAWTYPGNKCDLALGLGCKERRACSPYLCSSHTKDHLLTTLVDACWKKAFCTAHAQLLLGYPLPIMVTSLKLNFITLCPPPFAISMWSPATGISIICWFGSLAYFFPSCILYPCCHLLAGSHFKYCTTSHNPPKLRLIAQRLLCEATEKCLLRKWLTLVLWPPFPDTWVLLIANVVVSIIGVITIGDKGKQSEYLTTMGVAILYAILFIPGAFCCWFMPLYHAYKWVQLAGD